MKWEKKKPIEDGVSTGCVCCGTKGTKLPSDRILAVGFGDVCVTKNGVTLWSGDDPEKSIAEFEAIAKADPDHDYQVRFTAPLWDGVWQRHSDDNWMLIEKGRGFA